jgi:hypothetical protein
MNRRSRLGASGKRTSKRQTRAISSPKVELWAGETQVRLPEALRTELSSANIAPDTVGSVLEVFGLLPISAREEMARQLMRAVVHYRHRSMIKDQNFPTRSTEKFHLEGISAAARKTLKLLGIHDAGPVTEDWNRTLGRLGHSDVAWLLIGLDRPARQRLDAPAELRVGERFLTLLSLLSDLVEVTTNRVGEIERRGADKSRQMPRNDRGAHRSQPKNQLLREIIDIYATFRSRFRESGPKIACDQTLRNFVRAVLKVTATSSDLFASSKYVHPDMLGVQHGLEKESVTSDASIRGEFERWRRAQTKKLSPVT